MSWRREGQLDITESMDSILDVIMGKTERLYVGNLELWQWIDLMP